MRVNGCHHAVYAQSNVLRQGVAVGVVAPVATDMQFPGFMPGVKLVVGKVTVHLF